MSAEQSLALIRRAIDASSARTFFSAFPEHPKAYEEAAALKAEEDLKSLLGQPFDRLRQPATTWLGEEISPYTLEPLGITYPADPPARLLERALRAAPSWAALSPAQRADILGTSLERLRGDFFLLAHATMHTTGQGFLMAFQASGPHAADRALEALAMGYQELTRFPEEVVWTKPAGKGVLTLKKTYRPVPRGTALVIGCSTFPVWNSIPALYADLITGNPVIVKPHPGAVLPTAIVVGHLQDALAAAGQDPLLCQLAADTLASPMTRALCEEPGIRLIDYTGGSAFGRYVESLPGKTVFTEKSGVNTVILDAVEDMEAVAQNLAFSASLYSGQMCTAPQTFFIPAEGIQAGGERLPYEAVVASIRDAVAALAAHPKAGPGTLGAIQRQETLDRLDAAGRGTLVLEGAPVAQEGYPRARTRSPSIWTLEADEGLALPGELFGPAIVLVRTTDTADSLARARELALREGAITCAAYATDPARIAEITAAMNSVFVPVTFNLRGPVWVNQHAAFSDFHVTGGNPAGNAGFTTPDFVVRRFVWVGNRIMEG